MVNTFLLYSPEIGNKSPYAQSAAHLDSKRLVKQCLEAHQILSVITDLFVISQQLAIPLPTQIRLPDITPYDVWVGMVTKTYKKQSYKIVKQDDKLYKVETSDISNNIYFVLNSKYKLDKTYFILPSLPPSSSGGNASQERYYKIMMSPADYRNFSKQEYTSKARMEVVLPRSRLLITSEGDHIMSLAWSSHPASRMWIPYAASLRVYINDHLHEYSKRTRNHMNIPSHPIDATLITHPWWATETIDVVMSHRAALLRKELCRNESPHYITLDICRSIPDCYRTLGYVWISNLSADAIMSLLRREFNPLCFTEVTNDDIDITTTSVAYTTALSKCN